MNVSNTRRIEMLAHGRIGPTLFKLSAPAIVGMLVMAVYNVVDTFFVSLLRDTTAVAATGIVFPIFQLVAAIGLTFGMGAASVISRRLGEGDYEGGFYFRKKGALEPFRPGNYHPTAHTYRDIMVLGLPTFVRQILGSISFGIVNNAAGSYGDSAIAAISVTFRLFMLLLMGLMGLAQGLQPLAGYNYGARNFDRVRKTFRIVFEAAVIICAVAAVGSFIFAAPFMRIFTPQDPEVVAMGVLAIRMMAVALVPVGLVLMFGGIFQALGDGRSALVLAAGQQGLFLIPLVLILPRLFGLPGVFAAQPAGFFLAFLIGLVLMKKRLSALPSQAE